MKTIADYQPHPLIREAIDALAAIARRRKVDFDAELVLVSQVAYDMHAQGIAVPPGSAVEWVGQAIAALTVRQQET